MPEGTESLLAFPCEFPIKVMGRTQPGFAEAVVGVVQRHAPDFDAGTVECAHQARPARIQPGQPGRRNRRRLGHRHHQVISMPAV